LASTKVAGVLLGDALCPSPQPAKEVERFEREFVSLFAIARQQGRHFRLVKKGLQHAGVEPVFDPKKIGATFYRKSDLEQP
jgi:hypothetical protein